MRLFIERQLSKVYHYLQKIVERELRLAEAELRKYEDSLALLGVGVLFLVLGKFTGIVYLSLIGALGLAVALLKGLKEEK